MAATVLSERVNERVQVHANAPGGRRNMAPRIPGNRLPQLDASPQDLSGHPMLANANRTFFALSQKCLFFHPNCIVFMYVMST